MEAWSGRRPALDVLRAVAALGVVFGHAGMLTATAHVSAAGVAGFVAQNGWKGIYLFFAISGYLIARPFVRAALGAGPRVDVGRYALRRAARILPAHWLALTAMAVLLVVDTAAVPQDLTGGRFLAHFLLIQNFVPGVAQTILPVTWTLGLEAIFYVTVPVAFWLATRGGRRVLSPRALLVGLGLVWVAAAAVYVSSARYSGTGALGLVLQNALLPVLGYLAFFAPGVAAAALEAAGWLRLPRWAAGALLGAALALWVTAGALSGLGADAVDALFGGVAVLGVVASSGRARLPRTVVALGEASYGLYLWHWLVLNVLRWAAAAAGVSTSIWTNQVGDWMLVAGLTFPIAWLSWTRVERPAMAWARGHRAVPRTATVGAVR